MHRGVYEALLRLTLAEDLGVAGDVTTEAVVPADAQSRGTIVARDPGRIAGLEVAAAAFEMVDSAIELKAEVEDGADVLAGRQLAIVSGPTRGLLTAERTALNLLGHLSGIATATAELVRIVDGTKARIADTRKTTPGLRALEKYAVRIGGGINHRFGLYDAVLIKDNHLVAAGGVRPAVEAARRQVGHLVKIEVEVGTLDELAELLEVGAAAVLLDNMDVASLRRAVEMVGGRMVTEASGGVTSASVRAIAETGVDLISVGWITHSSPSLDVALDLVGV